MKLSRKICLALVAGFLGASLGVAAPASADTSWACPGCKMLPAGGR